jgi:hypothetical protein
LHTGRAQALTLLGRAQEEITAIGLADEEFSRAQSSNDPMTLGY